MEEVVVERLSPKSESSSKVKETVWVKGGKKVAKETTPTRRGRGKKVEFEEEEEIVESEIEGSVVDEEGVGMEEKAECCDDSSAR